MDGSSMKSSLSMGASVSLLLAQAALIWEPSLKASGQWVHLLNNLDWAADYFYRAGNGSMLLAQVGDHFEEERYWGSPEMASSGVQYRPSYSIVNGQGEGGDVVSQAVAALAGVSEMVRCNLTADGSSSARADALLARAVEMWTWANRTDSVWQVNEGNATWVSQTCTDDKAWAAAWLCKVATDALVRAQACDAALAFYRDWRLDAGYQSAGNFFAAAALMIRDVTANEAAMLRSATTLKTHFLDVLVQLPYV